MKAAIILQKRERPQYTTNFPAPTSNNENEVVISVKAVAIKNLDKSMAKGKHYSSETDTSKTIVPGGDGVGLLPDGTRVYARGITGMLAEKAVVNKNSMVQLPEGLDNATAAALPNAIAGSAMALLFRAKMEKGETILINGATGVTGQMAVQLAKHYGAGKVIATGRNEAVLQSLKELGADTYLVTTSDEDFVKKLKEIHEHTPIDVVLDFLWGHPAELILEILKGKGTFTHHTRFVSIGSMAGETIRLSSAILRSVDLQLSGSGLGSWTKEEMTRLFTEILPETFQMAVDKRLKTDTQTIALKDIEQLWDTDLPSGKRLVVII